MIIDHFLNWSQNILWRVVDTDIDGTPVLLLEDLRAINKTSIIFLLDRIEHGFILRLIKCVENFYVTIINKKLVRT